MRPFTTLTVLAVLGLAGLGSTIPLDQAEEGGAAVATLQAVAVAAAEGEGLSVQLNSTTGRVSFVDDEGAYAGSLLEEEDGTVVFLDLDGSRIDLDVLANGDSGDTDEEEPDGVAPRAAAPKIPLKVLLKFAKLILKWGSRFKDWLRCVGPLVALDCPGAIVDCSASGTPPWKCVDAYACIGLNFKYCKF